MLQETLTRLMQLLPAGWSVDLVAGSKRLEPDAVISITSPSGPQALMDVALKRWTTAPTSSATGVLGALQRRSPNPVLLATDFTNPPLRRACEEIGVNYVDEAGWVYINIDEPRILIRTEGTRNATPTRRSHTVTRLNGLAVGRLMNVLLSAQPPLGVRALAETAKTSPGSASKLLPTLAAYDALERDTRGRVITIHRRRVLERWTQDYSFLNSNGVVLDFLAPRGLESALRELPHISDACLTGAAAARSYLPPGIVPLVPLTRLSIYASNPRGLGDRIAGRRSDRATSNVTITAPRDGMLVVDAQRDSAGMPRAPLPLVLADLLTLPGRESALAEQLMDQLAKKDDSWAER